MHEPAGVCRVPDHGGQPADRRSWWRSGFRWRCRRPAATVARVGADPATAPTLWYSRAATQWVEALPIGNGRLGAMIFGAIGTERLQVNDDTLWSGGPAAWDAPGARDALDEVRRLTLAGNFPGGTRSRATVGRLLRQGVAPAHVDPSYYQSHVPMQYGRDGGTPGGQWGPGEMPRPHHGRRTLPGMRFGLALGIAAEGGEVSVSPAGWRVQGATAATLIVATATGFNGFDRDPAREGRDPGPILVQQIDRALAMPGLACGTITSRMTARSSIASPSRCRPARPTTSRPIAASAIAAVAIPASSSCWRTADIRRGG